MSRFARLSRFVIEDWVVSSGEQYRGDDDVGVFMTEEVYYCLRFCVSLGPQEEEAPRILERIAEGRRKEEERKNELREEDEVEKADEITIEEI